jgi:Beta-propeller repeat
MIMSCNIVRGALLLSVFAGCTEQLSDDGPPALGAGASSGEAASALVFPLGGETGGGGWPAQFGTNVRDSAGAIATDTSGRVFVTGMTDGLIGATPDAGPGPHGNGDFFLAEFRPSGLVFWLDTQGTTTPDQALGAAADLTGRYVAGLTYGNLHGATNAGDGDMFVAKFGLFGGVLWSRLLGTNALDLANDMAIRGSSMFVAGTTRGSLDGNVSAGGSDGFLVKFDTNGIKQWTRQFGTTGTDTGVAVAVDSAGNAYVAGTTAQGLDGNPHAGNTDVFVVKYDGGGGKVWTRQLGTSGHEDAKGIAADASGNVYVVGDTEGSLDGQANAGSYDAFVTRYGPTGAKHWTRLFGTTGLDVAKGVCVDPFGEAYVTGRANGGLDGQVGKGGTDAFLVKFNAVGAKVWTRLYGSSADDNGDAVAWMPAAGGATGGATGGGIGVPSAVVAGTTHGALPGRTSFGERDVFVARFDSSGNALP